MLALSPCLTSMEPPCPAALAHGAPLSSCVRDIRQARRPRAGALHDPGHAHQLGGVAAWLRDLGHRLRPGAPARHYNP